jgi:hypothetical protein
VEVLLGVLFPPVVAGPEGPVPACEVLIPFQYGASLANAWTAGSGKRLEIQEICKQNRRFTYPDRSKPFMRMGCSGHWSR